MKIIFVSPFSPSEIGHGGNHRAYQILFDLSYFFGQENIWHINYEDWQKGKYDFLLVKGVDNSIIHRLHRNREFRRYITLYKNPIKIFSRTGSFSPYSFTYPDFIDCYVNCIESINEKVVCILEHPGMLKIIEINKQNQIPTILAPQNLESLDLISNIKTLRKLDFWANSKDFFDEIAVHLECKLSLSISKIETGLLSGLGINCQYYPYIPVGKISTRLRKIRELRKHSEKYQNQFCVIGSASHGSTRDGMRWLLEHWKSSRKLGNIQLIVAGLGTENLFKEYEDIKYFSFKGFIDQESFDELLINTNAIIIPQFRGFGALTRLSEYSCAGIPVISSTHPSFAIDLPPGITLVGNNWNDWENVILDIDQSNPQTLITRLYDEWESRQSINLEVLLRDYLR